jgi:glycosyltransferase involved in cell wall biosynthesis
MKKIAIDCRVLKWEHSGIARYLDNVLSRLLKIDKDNQYYLLTPSDTNLRFNGHRVRQVKLLSHDAIFKYFKIQQFLKREKIDIYWSPSQDLPLFKIRDCKYIATIHDIAFEYYMSWFSYRVRLMSMLGAYKRSARMADMIFATSEFTKQDVSNQYNIESSRIKVIYQGVDNRFKYIDKLEAQAYLKKIFDINDKYIFYVDTVRTRNLILAFANLVKNEWKNENIRLICLGIFSDKKQHPIRLAKELGIIDRIMHISKFISDLDLNNLYAGAEYFISPSYYEGFGLTPLEALKAGTPVIISNVTSLPEVFSDAALYCDPYDIKDIADKMLFLWNNENEKKRILLNSIELFKLYNWDKTVLKIKTLFNNLSFRV